MNNQEPQSRVKRYDFNKGSQRQQPRPKQFRVWPWIVGLVVVIGLLVFGIKLLTNNHQARQTTQSSSSTAMQSSKQHQSNHSKSTSKASSATSANSDDSSTKHDQNTPPAKSNSDSNNSFSGTRQFSSVADAQSWAKATQSSWLKAGYNNYTITSDGQGYYILNFTR